MTGVSKYKSAFDRSKIGDRSVEGTRVRRTFGTITTRVAHGIHDTVVNNEKRTDL